MKQRVNIYGKANKRLNTNTLQEEDLFGSIKAIREITRKKLPDKWLKGLAGSVTSKAFELAPKRTGKLSQSIKFTGSNANYQIEASALDRDGFDYAPIQEYGGVNQEGVFIQAQPYISPAFHLAAEAFTEALDEYIRYEGLENGEPPQWFDLRNYVEDKMHALGERGPQVIGFDDYVHETYGEDYGTYDERAFGGLYS